MKILTRILDNYFTEKLIKKIKQKFCMYDIEILYSNNKDYVQIFVNNRGKNEFKNPRKLAKIHKEESFELLLSNNFFKNLKDYMKTILNMSM